MNKETTILVVEDDRELCQSLIEILTNDGYKVITANTGEDCLQELSPDVDLIVLDVMLPGMSGIAVCREIRKSSYIPVLFLTAKSEEADKLLGLYAGGDDYLVKPFSFSELMARIHALLRRTCQYVSGNNYDESKIKKNPWILSSELRINACINEVYLRNRKLRLTEIEYQILVLLAKHPGTVFSLRSIFEIIWETAYMPNSGNVVTVHIRNLRQKIEDNPQSPLHVLTIWGKGYQFAKQT